MVLYQIPSQSERIFSYKVEQIREIEITLIARNYDQFRRWQP